MGKADSCILIAGGTGLLGKAITKKLIEAGYTVKVLTRGKSSPQSGLFHWNPEKGELDEESLEGVSIIINLAGVGVADKRWTEKRRQEIVSSRVDSTLFLFRKSEKLNGLELYITASGVNCYGYDDGLAHVETDPFGTDFLSNVVKQWETAADSFQSVCPVAKIRIATVLSGEGGALPVMAKPVKLGFGSKIGSGKQNVPWIHIDDVAGIFCWVVEHRLNGVFNAVAGNVTNEEFIRLIGRVLHKPVWAPPVPAVLLKILLGELSELALCGVIVDHAAISDTGFSFQYTELEPALKSIYQR